MHGVSRHPRAGAARACCKTWLRVQVALDEAGLPGARGEHVLLAHVDLTVADTCGSRLRHTPRRRPVVAE
eukprot:scaffold107502_cov75-Phaeocystis_antarctica.AAC.1